MSAWLEIRKYREYCLKVSMRTGKNITEMNGKSHICIIFIPYTTWEWKCIQNNSRQVHFSLYRSLSELICPYFPPSMFFVLNLKIAIFLIFWCTDVFSSKDECYCKSDRIGPLLRPLSIFWKIAIWITIGWYKILNGAPCSTIMFLLPFIHTLWIKLVLTKS